MNDGRASTECSRSIKEEGHQILKLDTNDDGTYTLFDKKLENNDYYRKLKE